MRGSALLAEREKDKIQFLLTHKVETEDMLLVLTETILIYVLQSQIRVMAMLFI